MKRIYVEEQWCLACHLCEYNCAFAHSGMEDMVKALKGKKLYPRIRVEKEGSVSFAVSCRHCEDPLCRKACISGALSIKDGRVQIDENKCVGCFTCVMVCPYGAIMPSEKGAVQKCDLCMETSGGAPACVKGCPNNAIVYQDRG